MHFTNLAIITLTSWSAFVSAAPTPVPQFFDPSHRESPPVGDNPYITSSADSGVTAHASLLGTYHKGQDGIYASNGLGTYQKSEKGTTLSSALGSIDKSGGATTYSSALGSIIYGKDGVRLEGPKSKPKNSQENVPQGVPQDFGPGSGWS
ncbi:hypothetical protein E2P81_ATG05830 [Venturia nashicola]|nr:hypothetical protein E2P81_ATG05830 [Venturia nashicola]